MPAANKIDPIAENVSVPQAIAGEYGLPRFELVSIM